MMSEKKIQNNKVETDAGIEINALYNSSSNISKENPGEFPFTRGVHAAMYRDKLWTMRQYAGFSTAEESNKRYHYLLKNGVSGLSVAFDLPTQIGYDSDHALAEGEVGKVGVAIDSLEDMETLFKGIKLEDVSTSMTINSTAYILLSLYIALAKKQGADLKKISGTIQNDILKEYAARGTYIYPPKASMRIITDIFEYCSKELPAWNTISTITVTNGGDGWSNASKITVRTNGSNTTLPTFTVTLGGRAGRIKTEVLVAMGTISGDDPKDNALFSGV